MDNLSEQQIPSTKELKRQILRGSWFLGVPPIVWGAVTGSAGYGWAYLWVTPTISGWILSMLGGWALAELVFLKRRLEAPRLAAYQRRQEITRLAMKKKVGLGEVA